jgi:hypothetical protein
MREADPNFHNTHQDISESAKAVAEWLVEQSNRVLVQERAVMGKLGPARTDPTHY